MAHQEAIDEVMKKEKYWCWNWMVLVGTAVWKKEQRVENETLETLGPSRAEANGAGPVRLAQD